MIRTAVRQVTVHALALSLVFALSGVAMAKSVGVRAESPRIATLKQAVERGEAGAVQEFWKQIEANGSPIVEPIAGDEAHVLMTLLARGGDEVMNVIPLFTDINWRTIDPDENQLLRLPGTDVWHRTWKAPSDLRNTYQMSVNDSFVPFGQIQADDRKSALAQRQKTWKNDPLNPHTFRDNPPNPPYSALAMPKATPQPYQDDLPHADVPKGIVSAELTIRSEILHSDRKFWVYTPAGHSKDAGPYPLLVMFDGPTYMDNFPTPVTLDNLAARKLIPPMVAVFVHHPDRNEDLKCNADFSAYVAKELVPWVREHYAVTDDPNRCVVAGSSLGGLGATYAAFQHPECFGRALAMTPAYSYGAMAEQVSKSAKLPLRIYITVGSLESEGHVASNRAMRDMLKAKGYPLLYTEFSGTHTYFSRQGRFAEGLIFLLNDNAH